MRPESDHLAVDPLAPLRFERRCAPREPADGHVLAQQADGEHFGRTHFLELRDVSPGGLGATSEVAIEPGTLVTVSFADAGRPVRRGVVRRCVPCGRGYEVAVEFQLRRAA
ncbi:MAG: PilZ domain-containing protein [Planctomycetota bacterium]